jgi:hypothetical protein
MRPTKTQLKRKIRRWLIFFIVLLALSGITAFPVETELRIAMDHLPAFTPAMQRWLSTIYNAIKTTNAQYPYLSYGTDWLAFDHLVIAIAFIGPLRDPVRNIWVLIDCSFGVIGIIPLYIVYRHTRTLEHFKPTRKPAYHDKKTV